MIVLALVLLVIVVTFSIAIVIGNPEIYQLSILRASIPVTSAGLFFTGAGAAVVTVVALWLLRTGIARSRIKRRELKALQRSAPDVAAQTAPATTTDTAAPASVMTPTGPASTRSKPVTAGLPAETATPSPKRTTDAAPTTHLKSAADARPTAEATSTRRPDADEPVSTTAAERRALLDEADEIAPEEPMR